MARLNRKISNATYEIIYKLGLDPNGAELAHICRLGSRNDEVAKGLLNGQTNELLGIKYNHQRAELPAKQLFEAYTGIDKVLEKSVNKICKDLEKFIKIDEKIDEKALTERVNKMKLNFHRQRTPVIEREVTQNHLSHER